MRGELLDLSGRRFGKWTVLGLSHRQRRSNGTRIFWLCRCDCGHQKSIVSGNLSRGISRSCGCLRNTQGGLTQRERPIYAIWMAMVRRCTKPSDPAWKNYGGRGIRVCSRWQDFRSFLRDMGPRPPKACLERSDNNGNYSPENCRWATVSDQARNRRNNITMEYRGQRMIMMDAARAAGINYGTLKWRHRKGLRGNALFAQVKH